MTENITTYKNILQNIIVNFNGIVEISENTLFEIKAGTQIKDFHPIFLSVLGKSPHAEMQTATYRGVCFSNENSEIVCDMIIKHELSFISITLFNYTSNYTLEQRKKQNENEKSIASNKIKTKKHPSLL